MFKCITKQDTKYAELLVNARPGQQYDPSAQKKSNLEIGLYELHVNPLLFIIYQMIIRFI